MKAIYFNLYFNYFMKANKILHPRNCLLYCSVSTSVGRKVKLKPSTTYHFLAAILSIVGVKLYKQ